MWVITGSFDAEYGDGPPPPQKSKLLKTGREYSLGRKDHPLTIRSKAISKSHAVFIVGPCTEEQAADPSFVPTLTIRNVLDRKRVIERPTIPSPRIDLFGNCSLELESEDVIHLSATVHVRVRWERVCCYNGSARAGPSISARECAALGIHISPTLHPDVTHHLTPTYALSPALATSLVSLSTLVKPEWLAAVLDAGRAEPGEPSTLEESFALPPPSKFRPSFAPALPPRLKKFDVWQPNEERVGLFRGRRFVFAGEKGAEAPSALKELVKRAEGEYECFAVESGPERLRQVLAKGRARGSALVLVADERAVVPAVGEEAWKALVDEARNFELMFLPPDRVVEAVVYADASYVDSSGTSEQAPQESILPDVVPNTIEDEPSIPPSVPARAAVIPQREPSPALEPQGEAPRRRLTRRATSRASSRAPSPPPPLAQPPPAISEAEEPQPEPVQPRRTLVRRAARPKTIVGIDDTTMDVDGASASARLSEEPSASASRNGSAVPPTPVRPSRLKRRVGTQAQSAAAASDLFPGSMDVDVLVPDAEEPPHKKYKSLFDESDPDRIAQLNLDEYASQHAGGPPAESITQYEPSMLPASHTTLTRSSGAARGGASGSGVPLEALAEEEEESTLASSLRTQTQARGVKRKSQEAEAEEDVQMEEAPPRAKRKTGEESQAQTQSKPLSKIVTRIDMSQAQPYVKEKPASKKASTGAAAGEPDKDDAFLKAVASTKRGKKKGTASAAEDTFDREFNNLRISKPDLERERETEAWAVLDDFEDDRDVRGNFMVVVEMPVFREGENADGDGRDYLRRGEGRLEWQGRPDFKKFRRKNNAERRQPVELVIGEEGDLGIGSQYWKGASQAPPSQSQPFSQPKVESSPEKSTQRATQRSARSRPTLVDDDEDDEFPEETLAASKPTSKTGKSQGKKSQTASKPPSTQSSRAGRSSRKQPLFIDSDAEEKDDGALDIGSDFDHVLGEEDEEDESAAMMRTRGSGTQAVGKGKKRSAPMVVDDDSDDGATFKAFGSRTRSSRKR